MKKILISLSLVLFTIAGFAQKLKPVVVDSLVTVSLPQKYVRKDTLGQTTYSGNSQYGYMVVIRAPNAVGNQPLDKERDLNKVLKDYIDGIKGQASGSAQYVRDTTIGRLKAKTFTLSINEGAGVKLRNFIIIYTKEVTYTFEYFYEEARQDVIKDEYKAFSSSIKLAPELTRTDQYLSNEKGISPNAKLGIYGGGALIVIIIIVVLVRRKKKHQEHH
ncbi:hypothetical protein [Mucilaginibacter sp.]|jgi:hypothetical protein|uniref:hypothetical protein n=1 Tax=Mucilaginibacter sp. TaxID=1882438 RepID=UPI00356651EF